MAAAEAGSACRAARGAGTRQGSLVGAGAHRTCHRGRVRGAHVGRFRHNARFRRWRADKDPAECTYSQLETVAPAELREMFGGARLVRPGSGVVPVRVRRVPLPRALDDLVDAELRRPSEHVGARRRSVYTATGSPARRPSFSTAISRPLTRFATSITSSTDEPLPVPRFTIVDLPPPLEMIDRPDVRVGEIDHVHVVANRGAVRRVVIGAEHLHVRGQPDRRLHDERHQVQCQARVFAEMRRRAWPPRC